jgi:hypothetical protein
MDIKEPNYNESVIIPLLQKKHTELTNANLVLEANLMVERAKNQFLSARLVEAQSKIDIGSKKKRKDLPELEGGEF